jgi:hypothetical protein
MLSKEYATEIAAPKEADAMLAPRMRRYVKIKGLRSETACLYFFLYQIVRRQWIPYEMESGTKGVSKT